MKKDKKKYKNGGIMLDLKKIWSNLCIVERIIIIKKGNALIEIIIDS